MIKLAHDLYKDFEEEYFNWIKEKLNGGDKLVETINSIVQKYPQYRIDFSKHEDFLKALLWYGNTKSDIFYKVREFLYAIGV